MNVYPTNQSQTGINCNTDSGRSVCQMYTGFHFQDTFKFCKVIFNEMINQQTDIACKVAKNDNWYETGINCNTVSGICACHDYTGFHFQDTFKFCKVIFYETINQQKDIAC